MSKGLNALNEDTIEYIGSFLSEPDRRTLIRKIDNHTLINLTKKARVKFLLTTESSLRYHEDEAFRQDVQSTDLYLLLSDT